MSASSYTAAFTTPYTIAHRCSSLGENTISVLNKLLLQETFLDGKG